MARWYVLIGPHMSAEDAKRSRHVAVTDDGYAPDRCRVAKLRDRTGQSVAERLSYEDVSALLKGLDASARLDATEKRLAALEADALDLRTRVGDLEREPVESPPATTVPTPEQIEAYLRGSAEWAQHPSVDRLWDHERSGGSIDITDPGLIKSLCAVESRTPAEMRARIIGVSTADPDRLAMRAAKGAK